MDDSEKSFWFVVYPFQCIIVAEEVMWTTDMTKACDEDDYLDAIKDIRSQLSTKIEEYGSALQLNFSSHPDKSLAKKLTMLIQGLLIRALYHRDLVEALLKSRCGSSSFEWLHCPKYHVDVSTCKKEGIKAKSGSTALLLGTSNSAKFTALKIDQLGFSSPYGYEYLGPFVHLIITPLTERCLLNITTAMRMFYCGAPFGPTQTGKTETVKEVSRMLGSHLITFTCSPVLSLSKILHFLSGAIQSGSFLCLEKADSLPAAILSVLGQNLDGMRRALTSLASTRVSQYETRSLSKKQKKVPLRRRGVTVLSLHTLVVTEKELLEEIPTEAVEDVDNAELKLNDKRPQTSRCHSVAEIISISDPRAPKSVKSTKARVTKSDTLLTSFQTDVSKDDFSGYHNPPSLGNIMFAGQLIKASPLYGCILTMGGSYHSCKEIPDNLRANIRPIAMTLPDSQKIIQIWLLCQGFQYGVSLSHKLITFKTMLQNKFLNNLQYNHGLATMRTVIQVASSRLKQNKAKKSLEIIAEDGVQEDVSDNESVTNLSNEELEQFYIGSSIHKILSSSILPNDYQDYISLLQVVFPSLKQYLSKQKHELDQLLLASVKEQIASDSLLEKEELVKKVMELHVTMQFNHSIILLGNSGSGKTVCYQTLCRALCQFYSTWSQEVKKRRQRKLGNTNPQSESSSFSKVNLSVLYPKTVTNSELFGGLSNDSLHWNDGLLPKLLRAVGTLQDGKGDMSSLRTSSATESIDYWFVFDGPIDASLTSSMESLLDQRRELSLANGENLKLPASCWFMMETTSLSDVSPSIISRCSIVNFQNNQVDWRCIFYPWKRTARTKFTITLTTISMVEELLEYVMEPLLKFLIESGGDVLVANTWPWYKDIESTVPGVTETSCILSMFTSVLERYCSRETMERKYRSDSLTSDSDLQRRSDSVEDTREQKVFISNAFAYAFVWGIGGRMHKRSTETFGVFTRQLFATCPYPVIFPCSVFEAILDPNRGELVRWQGRSSDLPKLVSSHTYIVVPELIRYAPCCSHYDDFRYRHKCLVDRLLSQGYTALRLEKSFKKFYGRYQDLIEKYQRSVKIERYFAVVDLLISAGFHTLIVGEVGVGKSSFIQNLISSRNKFQKLLVSQSMETGYFQKRVQEIVQEYQRRLNVNPLKPPPTLQKSSVAAKSLFFIDDLSLAPTNENGNAQPIMEVIRQIMSEGGVYDRDRRYFQHLAKVQFVGACVPAGSSPYGLGVSNHVPSVRVTRRMNVINFQPFSSDSLHAIYASMFKYWLEEFPAYSLTHHERLAKAMSSASVSIYRLMKAKLPPTPSQPHYTFSYHDLARLAKGVFIYSSKVKLRTLKPSRHAAEQEPTVMKSLPELRKRMTSSPDPSPSHGSIDPRSSFSIEKTPATVSPLIRTIVRLWSHECLRMFQDRIVESSQRDWFASALLDVVQNTFCASEDYISYPGTPQSSFAKGGPEIAQVPELTQSDYETFGSKGDTNEPKNEAPIKHRVKFKDIENARQDDYRGPLITLKQLLGDNKDLRDLTFSKHLMMPRNQGLEGISEVERGYVECKQDQLEESLEKAINLFNSGSQKPLDLVSYKEALHHAVKISRILAMSGGHALLISLMGHGRANTVKLVAKLSNIKVVEAGGKALQSQNSFRKIVKDASYIAGLQGRPVILFIPEGFCDEGLKDVSALLVEGTCPGLYSSDELTAISNQLLPGGQMGVRRTENKEVAQERFLRRIRTNLHVAVCVWHGDLQRITQRYPTILTRSACVDVFREWKSDVLTTVAKSWLLEKGTNQFLVKVPWDIPQRDVQLKAIYEVMSQIHQSVRRESEKDFSGQGLEVFSPLKFTEFIDLFRTLCNWICEVKENELSKLRLATDKVQEGELYVEDLETSITNLTPLLEGAQVEVKEYEKIVKSASKEYQDARAACEEQQKEIDKLTEPLERLEQEAHNEFDKLSPLYEAAMSALDLLDYHDVDEIKSYREPPCGVKLVTDAICIMFNKPANWEEAKLLFIGDNFFQDLQFYDKDHIPDAVFKRLKQYQQDPGFNSDALLEVSKAASSISMWIGAIYRYGEVVRALNPKKEAVAAAEKKLNQAKILLGEKRVRSNELKEKLETEIETYRTKVKDAKSLEKQIQTLLRIKNGAVGLLESMKLCTDYWHVQTTQMKTHLETAPGDALLAAAAVIYLGVFEQDTRQKLQNLWQDLCTSGVNVDMGKRSKIVKIPINPNFAITAILSSEEEQMEWKKKGLPRDQQAVVNGLIMRTCCFVAQKCWPILIDPHDEADHWVRAIEDVMTRIETGKDITDRTQTGKHNTVLNSLLHGKYITTSRSSLLPDSRPSTQGIPRDFTKESLISQDMQSVPESDRVSTALSGRTEEFESDRDTRSALETESTPATPRTIRTALSTLTVNTDSSHFLKKFYRKAGLKMKSETTASSPILSLKDSFLLTLDADDEDLDSKLKAAISYGVPTLVSHLERGCDSIVLNSILSRRILVSDDGSLQILVGSKTRLYNPNFRLYLSASVPMSFTKTHKYVLPLHKTVPVNMAISPEGLMEKFISHTIQAERPELESQRKSLELDLFYLREENQQIQDRILDMIIHLPGKILEETSLPAVMANSKDQLTLAEERYKEVEIFQNDITSKRKDYQPVAVHATMLYKVMLQISQLHSYYEVPLDFFIQLFKRALVESKRSKAIAGSVMARAAELKAFFTEELYKKVCLTVFKEHILLFPFLVVIETLRKESKISPQEWDIFLKLSTASEPRSYEDTSKKESNQQWPSSEILQRFALLESSSSFSGIAESLQNQSYQWEEYFDMPPMLVSSPPHNFGNLNIFEKTMLWAAVCPEKLSSVCRNLVLCQLGPTFTEPIAHDLSQVYQHTESTTPILLMLPDSDQPITEEPVTAIQNLGKSLRVDIILISLGLPSQITSAVRAIREACGSGKWVILENCHLETTWSKEFLRLLEEITLVSDEMSQDHSSQDNLLSFVSTTKSSFRLWLLMRNNSETVLPVVLSRKSLKMAWDCKNWSSMEVQHVEKQALCFVTSKAESRSMRSLIHELSSLHFKLLTEKSRHSFSIPYKWSTHDIKFGVQLLSHLSKAVRATGSLSLQREENFLPNISEYLLYGPGLIDEQDAIVLQDITASLRGKQGSVFLISSDNPSNITNNSNSKAKNSRPNFKEELTEQDNASRTLQDSLKIYLQEPVGKFEKISPFLQKLDQISSKIDSVKKTLNRPVIPISNRAVVRFLTRELFYFRNKLEKIDRDISLTREFMLGRCLPTSQLENFLEHLSTGKVPPAWLVIDDSCTDAIELIENLYERAELLISYIRPKSRQPCYYDLGVFSHPKGFLGSVLEDFAGERKIDVEKLVWVVEMWTNNDPPRAPPVCGVYINNLQLQNGAIDNQTGYLVETSEQNIYSHLPVVLFKPCMDAEILNMQSFGNSFCEYSVTSMVGRRRQLVAKILFKTADEEIQNLRMANVVFHTNNVLK